MNEPNPYDQPTQPAPYGQSYPYPVAPDHPQGTTVLVLGILSLFFGILGPVAWYMGSKALKEVRASGRTYNNLSSINAGRIIGMIVTILIVVSLVLGLVGLIIFAIAAAASQ